MRTRIDRLLFSAFAIACIVLVGCGGNSAVADNDSPDCLVGTLGCACLQDSCFTGLVCANGICATADSDGVDLELPDNEYDSPDCLIGTLDCGCFEGYCFPGLVCANGVCTTEDVDGLDLEASDPEPDLEQELPADRDEEQEQEVEQDQPLEQPPCAPDDGFCCVNGRAAHEGEGCNDSFFCTSGETCHAGACWGLEGKDCTAEVSLTSPDCQEAVCDETNDACIVVNTNEGGECEDGLFCSFLDRCRGGVCLGSPRECVRSVTITEPQCQRPACDENSDACVVANFNEREGCEDGEFCTVGERCLDGACVGGFPKDCVQEVTITTPDCQEAVCDEVGDACQVVNTNEGQPCGDNSDPICIGLSTCADGNCARTSAPAVNCPENKICDPTTASCHCSQGYLEYTNGAGCYPALCTLTWIPIPEGSFEMGCSPSEVVCHPETLPRHSVTLTAFQMTQTEITQGQYEAVIGSNPSIRFLGNYYPVTMVTWIDAKTFCERIGGRLPTEAEWEYAIRAGTTTRYYLGDDEEDACFVAHTLCWNMSGGHLELAYDSGGNADINPWRLHQMLGNALEWCEDWYDENYYWQSGTQNPVNSSIGTHRVIRSGSYNWRQADPSSFRNWAYPDEAWDDLGIRCVRDCNRDSREFINASVNSFEPDGEVINVPSNSSESPFFCGSADILGKTEDSEIAVGHYMKFALEIQCPGLYTIKFTYPMAKSFGRAKVFVDDQALTEQPFDVDMYTDYPPTPDYPRQFVLREDTLGDNQVFLNSGWHYIELRVVGKNPQATNYRIGADFFQLIP